MPLYDFKALTAAGKAQRGTVDAENVKAARQKLKKQGLMVTEITEKTAARPASGQVQLPFVGGRINAEAIALMTRQLASLVKANIPLVDALNALVEQVEIPALKVVMAQVRQDVNEGLSFAKATAKHPRVFDNIFVNMIEAGESSGTLGLVLLRLADLKEAQMRLRAKVISAMTYPTLMMSVGLLLMIGIFVKVIPQVTQIFDSMGKPMPPTTQVLIAISGALTTYWYLFLAGAFASIYLFRRWQNSPVGRRSWDAFTLRAPIFGELVRLIAVTRFARTMGTLLASGVPILGAMNIARNLVGNVPIENAISSARENITEGQSIADPLRRSGMFPPMVIHMIAIGEKTGELPQMLVNVADTYDEQINAKVEAMTSLLEPIMIIGMGGIVGFIVFSIFVPLLEMNNLG